MYIYKSNSSLNSNVLFIQLLSKHKTFILLLCLLAYVDKDDVIISNNIKS